MGLFYTRNCIFIAIYLDITLIFTTFASRINDTYTLLYIMAELEVKETEQVVVRFSGDSGDGM